MEYQTANGFSRRYERQHRHGLQGEEGEHTMMRLMLNDDPGDDPDEDDHHYLYDDYYLSLPASPFIRRPSKSNSFHSHVRLPGEW